MSLRKKNPKEYKTMSQALGIPDSGILLQRESTSILDPNEPLEKLLLNRRFRQSFMEFADRFYSFSFCENLSLYLHAVCVDQWQLIILKREDGPVFSP